MKTGLNTKGYNLHMLALDKWVYDDQCGDRIEGTFLSIMLYSQSKGFHINDLEEAVEDMIKLNHDSAHFGMGRTRIFTFNRKESKVA